MKVASAARELTLPSDDTGLRTALRNVPLLPAPANVDDLLARLGADEAPFSSGPLADLISDARYAEPAPAADNFFAPVSLAANSNRRARLARRLASGVFTMTLMAGVLLVVWNALVGPDAPTTTPALDTVEATRRDLAPAVPVAAEAPALELQAESALPPETAVEPPAPENLATPLHATALPEVESVVDTPGPIVVAEAREAADALQLDLPLPPAVPGALDPSSQLAELTTPAREADTVAPETFPAEQPAALSTLPEPARDADLTPGETLAAEQALAMSAPNLKEPPRDAEAAAQSETLASEQVVAISAPAMPEPTHEAVPTPGESLTPEPQHEISSSELAKPAGEAEAAAASPPLVSPQTLAIAAPAMPEPARAVDAQSGTAGTLPEPTDLREPQSQLGSMAEPEILASKGSSAASEAGTASSHSPEAASAQLDTTVAPPVRPVARERVAFAGTWAAVPEACAPDVQEDEGHLLARIGAWGGRAGDTACAFKTVRRRANTWLVNAACSDGEASWRSDVRLSLTRGRLTWTSQKGSTTYQRCPRA
jgi:hypothetical protein